VREDRGSLVETVAPRLLLGLFHNMDGDGDGEGRSPESKKRIMNANSGLFESTYDMHASPWASTVVGVAVGLAPCVARLFPVQGQRQQRCIGWRERASIELQVGP
jgi:hypothetical protein